MSVALIVDLSQPDNSELVRGRPLLIEALWYFAGLPLLSSHYITSSRFRAALLRMFGARVGKGVCIKPRVRVKFPWYLTIGDHSWIGEEVWIDNLAEVRIGAHSCVSQGAYLCTGNHDWSHPHMKLYRRPIVVGQGVWIAARALICPGVEIGDGAIVSAGSVVSKNVPPFEIHSGNPARMVRLRRMTESSQPQ
jgi:putative colanic acid biosynthesis acetyltransferase WcaF